MHYLDQDTFWALLSNAWKRHAPYDGMSPEQLKESLIVQGAVRDVNAVSMDRPASIRFLDMRMSRRTYMKKIAQVQAVLSETLPKGAGDMTGHHGWQPALMTGVMWMADIVGEYLTKMDRRPEVSQMQLPHLIDDPVSMLEQAVVDLKLAHEAKEVSGILKQLGLLLYYTTLMATTMHLHPYLSSTFVWTHAWQLSKIYSDLGKAKSAYEVLQEGWLCHCLSQNVRGARRLRSR